MINKVRKFIKQNNLFKHRDSVILGVSGGADSMFMLYALNEIKEEMELDLYVVHINHHIRGEQADRDADFVREVCEKLNIKFTLEDVNVPEIVKATGMSEEEAGRVARYEIFAQEMETNKADKIAIAHNLNDNSETILFNLFRGTGIKGLTGIPVKRENIVRPIMCVTREEIEKYLEEKDIEFCVDVTNSSTEYTRNKIRLELLPNINANINEKATYNIVNAAENLKEISDFVTEETAKAYDVYVKNDEIDDKAFELHNAIFSQLVRMVIEKKVGKLKDITRIHISAVMELRDMEVSKSVNLPYNLVAMRTYNGISIKKKEKKQYDFTEQVIFRNDIIFDNEIINISLENQGFKSEDIVDLLYTKWIDYDKITKLSLRNRLPGDYLIVDDKGSKKKLKDYLIDVKVPREKRDKLLLVADGSHIVWIIGHRISAYYKVTNETTKILKLTAKNIR